MTIAMLKVVLKMCLFLPKCRLVVLIVFIKKACTSSTMRKYHSPTYIRPTHLPTHPRAKILQVDVKNVVWGLRFHPRKIAVIDHLSPCNPRALSTPNIVLPTQNVMFDARPHAKF